MWIQRKINTLKSTGELYLESERRFNFQVLSEPDVYRDVNKIRKLNIKNTPIENFDFLPIFPRLTHIVLDKTMITNIKNFRNLPNLINVSCKNTPITAIPYYKLSFVLISDGKIKTINDKQISPKILDMAKEYPPSCKRLINAGWMATYPCPDTDELTKLMEELELDENDDSGEYCIGDFDRNNKVNIKEDSFQKREPFEVILKRCRNLRDDMLTRAQALFGIVESSDAEFTFEVKLAHIFRKYGFHCHPNDKNEIIRIVAYVLFFVFNEKEE